MKQINITKYCLIISSTVGSVFALAASFIFFLVHYWEITIIMPFLLLIGPVSVFILHRKVRNLLRYKDAVLISLYSYSFFGILSLALLSFLQLSKFIEYFFILLSMSPMNIFWGVITARLLTKKKNEVLRKVTYTIGIGIVTSVIVAIVYSFLEREYDPWQTKRGGSIGEISIYYSKYSVDNRARLELYGYWEGELPYDKIKITTNYKGVSFEKVSEGVLTEVSEVMIPMPIKETRIWRDIVLKISPEHIEKPESLQVNFAILTKLDQELGSKTITLSLQKWPPATRYIFLLLMYAVILVGISGIGRELFLIFRLVSINRSYEDFDRLFKWVNEDYIFALKEIKKSIKDIYSSEMNFILQAIEAGDKTGKNEAISKLLRHLLLVVESLQETEKVGYGHQYLVGLSDAIELLTKAKKSYIIAIDSTILRGVLQKTVDIWLEHIDILKSSTSREVIIEFKLKTKEIFINRPEILEVSLSNTGAGPARAVTVEILPGSKNLVVKGNNKIRKYLISEKEEFITKFAVSARTAQKLPVNFQINYLDQEGNSKTINIEESINALSSYEEREFKQIINPYEFGKPIKTKNMFFGREDIIDRIKEEVGDKDSPTQPIALLGQRRIGKTSILYRTKDEFSNRYIPCFVDMQKTNPKTPQVLFHKILHETKKEFEKHTGTKLPEMTILNKDYEEGGVYLSFEEDLNKLDKHLEEKGLPSIIFLFDEIESLREFDEEGDMMGFFRGLIQSSNRLLFIVSGSDILFRLTTDYASPFYNLFSTVECKELTEDETRSLIIEPSQSRGVRYSDDRAIKFIIESTGCNPYLTQALCNYIIRQLNKEKKYEVSLTDARRAAENFVFQQKVFFLYLWDNTTPIGRLILYYFAKIDANQTPEEILRSLRKETEIEVDLSQISEQIKLLIERRILIAGGYVKEQINSYWFINKIFPRWINIAEEAKIKTILKEIPKHK